MLERSSINKTNSNKSKKEVTWASDGQLVDMRFYDRDAPVECCLLDSDTSRLLQSNGVSSESMVMIKMTAGIIGAGLFAYAMGAPFSDTSVVSILGVVAAFKVSSLVSSANNISRNRNGFWAVLDEMTTENDVEEWVVQQKSFVL